MHGPYGPTKTESGPERLRSLAEIRANIRFSDLRIMQATQSLQQTLGPLLGISDPKQRWYKHLCTYWDDPRVPAVFGYYAENLRDICETSVDAGAQVLLCTVPVNLRHWRPVFSRNAPGLSGENESQWKTHFAAGQQAQEQGNLEAALATYQQAAEMDATYADLQFRMGQCYWKRSGFDAARECYEKALEYDSFFWVRSRARTNEIIRETAARLAPRGVHLADIKGAIESESPYRCPGDELFLDYCHLNPKGAFLMARELEQRLVPALPAWVRAKRREAGETLGFEECMRRLGLTQVALAGYWKISLDSDMPFDDESRAMMREELARVQKESPPDAIRNAYREGLQANPSDFLIRYRYILLLLDAFPLELPADIQPSPEILEALEQARTLAGQFPERRGSLRLLGEALARTGHLEEAADTLERAVARCPGDHTALGDYAAVALRLNRPEDAWRMIRQAPDRGEPTEMIFFRQRKACVLAARGDTDGAAEVLAGTIKDAPGYAPQYDVLDRALAGQPGRIVAILEPLLAEMKEKKLAQFHLGKAKQALGDLPGALAAYGAAAIDTRDTALAGDVVAMLLPWAATLPGEDAATVFREVQRYRPGNLEAILGEGAALESMGQLEQAESAYRRALKTNAGDVRAYERLDLLCEHKGGPKLRVQLWRDLTAEHPKDARGQFLLGKALQADGKQDLAAGAYRTAVELDPSDPAPKDALRDAESLAKYAEAELSRNAGEAERACALYRESIAMKPAGNPSFEPLDALYVQRNDPAARIALWQALAVSFPDNARVHWHLGQALEAVQNLAGAIEAYRKAVQLDPNDPAPRTGLANIEYTLKWDEGQRLEQSGDWQAAVRAYGEAIAAMPSALPSYERIDRLSEAHGDPAGRIAIWREIAERAPAAGRPRFCLGRALESAQDIPGAIAAYRKAVELDASDPAFHANLGLALMAAGDHQSAIPSLEKALTLNPDIAVVRIHLIEALYRTKAYAQAGKEMSDAVARGLEIPSELAEAVKRTQ